MDDFVIYDGRVGAALGLIVRQFCQESGFRKVPDFLRFAYGNARQGTYTKGEMNRRNPGTAEYKFPQLTNNYQLHTENNLKANWLLKELVESTSSRFSLLPKEIKLRALESALFMIGYDVISAPKPVMML